MPRLLSHEASTASIKQKRTAAFIAAARSIAAEEAFPASLVMREPVGVVAAITPWNYPLGQIIQKVVPALLMAARLCSSRANGRRLPPFCSLKPLKRPDFRPGFSILYRDTVKP